MNTTEQKFDLEYFIAKFEAISDDRWGTLTFINGDKCCALGFCGAVRSVNDTEEAKALISWCEWIGDVNDNYRNKYGKYGDTPKQRVVNYLKSLR